MSSAFGDLTVILLWGTLDLRHVFRSKKVLVFGAMEDIEWWVFSPKLKPIHRASIHPIHFDEFFFSSSYGQILRKHNFCRCILPWTWLGRIVKFIGIWILNPLKTSSGQPVALGGFDVWLGGYFLAWVLIDTIIHPCFKHAVSYVARVCAFGHWNPRDFEPSKTSGGQSVALEASVFGFHFWDSIDHFCFWWLLRFHGDILWKC